MVIEEYYFFVRTGGIGNMADESGSFGRVWPELIMHPEYLKDLIKVMFSG